MMLLNEFRMVDQDQRFMEYAACRGMALSMFFVDQGNGNLSEGREICRTCPVRGRCLEFAINNEIEHGLWGGLSPVERRAPLQERRRLLRLMADERDITG